MRPGCRPRSRRAGAAPAGGWRCCSCGAAGRPAQRVAGPALEELDVLGRVEVDDEALTLGVEVVYRTRISRTPLPATDVALARKDLLTDRSAENHRVARLGLDTRHHDCGALGTFLECADHRGDVLLADERLIREGDEHGIEVGIECGESEPLR